MNFDQEPNHRFSMFIPVELNVLEAAIFCMKNSSLVRKEYVDVVYCLMAEIRKEQERIKK